MDRYTFYVLEFLEEVNPASQTNMNDLVSILLILFQHIGVLAFMWFLRSVLQDSSGCCVCIMVCPFELQNYAYLSVWVYIRMHVCTCMHVSIYVHVDRICVYMWHMCACVFIYVHVCAYVHVQRPEDNLRES